MFKYLEDKRSKVFDDNGPMKFYLDFDFEDIHYYWDEEIKKYGGITVDEPDENTFHLVLNPKQKLRPYPWDIYDSLLVIDSINQKKFLEPDEYKLKSKICFGPIMFRSHRNKLAEESKMFAQKKIKVEEKIIGITEHDRTAIRPDFFYGVNNMLNPLKDCDDKDKKILSKKFQSNRKNLDKDLSNFVEKKIESTRVQQNDFSHESSSDDEWIQSSQIVDAVEQKKDKFIDKNAEHEEQKKLNGKNKIISPINCQTLKKQKTLTVFLANSQNCTRGDDGEKDLIMHDEKIRKDKLPKNCERSYSENDEKWTKKVGQKPPEKAIEHKSLDKIKQKAPEKITRKSPKKIKENIRIYLKPGPLSSKQQPKKLFGVNCREIPYPVSSDEELEIIYSNDQSNFKINKENSKVSNKKKRPFVSDAESSTRESPPPPKTLCQVIPTKKLPRPQTKKEELSSSNNEIETKIKSNKKQLYFSNVESGSKEATLPPKMLPQVIVSKKNKTTQTEEVSFSDDENKKYESPKKIRKIDFNKPSTSGTLLSHKKVQTAVIIDLTSSSEDDDEREEQVNKKALTPPKRNVSEKQLAGPSVALKEKDDIRVVTVNDRKIEIPSSLKKPYPRSWLVGTTLYFKSDLVPRNSRGHSSKENKYRFFKWEQDAMIRFVCEKRYFNRTGSRRMWAEMIRKRPGELDGNRTDSALKEHWKRVLMNKIHEYELPPNLFNSILNKRIMNK